MTGIELCRLGGGENLLPIASHVIPASISILLDTLNHRPIRNPHTLQQRRKIIHIKVPIRTPMRLPRTRSMFCQDLLATIRAIPATPTIRITTDITVAMTHVVPILLVESIVRNLAEPAAPKDQTLLEIQPDALEEQRVLQTAVVLEVGVAAKAAVQVGHAGGEVLGEVVDVAGADLGTLGDGGAGHVGAVGGDEVLGEVVEDGHEAVILVEVGYRLGCELDIVLAPSFRPFFTVTNGGGKEN